MLALPCNKGGLPFIVPHEWNQLLDPSVILAINAFDVSDSAPACRACGGSYREFIGAGDRQILLTVRSSLTGPQATAPSVEAGPCGDTEKGRTILTPKLWSEMFQLVRPNYIIPPYDAVNPLDPVVKKAKTASARSEKWIKEATTLLGEDSSVKCFAPILRDVFKDEADSQLAGPSFLACANFGEPLPTRISWVSRLAPSCQVLCVAETIPALILSLQAGASIIESPIPFQLAEKGCALDLQLTSKGRCRTPILNLHNQLFRNEKTLLSSCGVDEGPSARHTRSYIHHLLRAQEMNAGILLALHNVAQLRVLFSEFRTRKAVDHKEAEKYLAVILQQFD